MPLLKSVPEDKRTQWWIYPDEVKFNTRFLLNVGVLTVSQDMIDVMIGELQWSGFRYTENEKKKIGYGRGNPDLAQGMTETQSYGEFIEFVRDREKTFIKQLPVVEMPRSAFDALFSLYLDTGNWRTVKSLDGNAYDMKSAVLKGDWKLCADMLMLASGNRNRRTSEARAIALGQYIKKKSREELRSLGLQNMRRLHVENLFEGSFERKQAEQVYYRETSNFFPSITNARQRQIVRTAI